MWVWGHPEGSGGRRWGLWRGRWGTAHEGSEHPKAGLHQSLLQVLGVSHPHLWGLLRWDQKELCFVGSILEASGNLGLRPCQVSVLIICSGDHPGLY